MKDQNYNTQEDSRLNVQGLTSFYNENKNIINGIGIAALAGAAVYTAAKYVPFKSWFNKLDEVYTDQFGDQEYSQNQNQGYPQNQN